MSDEIKNVIIIGAGGNLGPSILQALEKDSHFTVSVLSRKSSSSKFPPHIKVHQIDDTYPEDQLLHAFHNQDAIILLLPPSEAQTQKTIIDVAIKAGVKRIIPSEFGSSIANQKIIDQVPVFQGKQEVNQYLESKESTGLTWTGVINGGFFDWGLKAGFFGFDLKTHTATIYDDGKHVANLTKLSTIGAAVASILKHPSTTRNKHIYISDYNNTQLDILAALEKATGGKKWTVTHKSTDETRKEGFDKLSKGDYSGIVLLIIAMVYSGDPEADYSAHKELANEKLGLPKAEPLDVAVAKIIKGEEV